MLRAFALTVVVFAVAAGCVPHPETVPASGMIGGTRSLFLGERGFGQFNRDVESTTGERIREALRTRHALGVDILNRMAIELTMLESADPPADLAAAAAKVPGVAGRFLVNGARRYAFVVRQSREHPVADPCGYMGELHQGSGERYDPRELCWWEGTFRAAGLIPGVRETK